MFVSPSALGTCDQTATRKNRHAKHGTKLASAGPSEQHTVAPDYQIMTTLRLSSATELPTTASCGNSVLDRLLQDPSLSSSQKADCVSALQRIEDSIIDHAV